MEFIQSPQFNVKKIKFQRMIADPSQSNPQTEMVSSDTKQYRESAVRDDKFCLDQNSSLLLSSIQSKSLIAQPNPNKKIKLQLLLKEETRQAPQGRKEKEANRKKKIWLVLREPLMEKNTNHPEQPLKPSPELSKIRKTYQTEQCGNNQILISDQNLLASEIKSEQAPIRSSLSYSTTNKPAQQDCTSVKSKSIHFSVADTKSLSTQSKPNLQPTDVKPSTHIKHKIIQKMSHFLNSHPTNITIDLVDRSKRQKSKSRSRSKTVKSNSKQSGTEFDYNKVEVSEFFTDQNETNESIQRVQQKIRSYKFVDEYMQKLQVQSHLRGFQIRKEPECKWALLLVDEVFKKIRSANTFENIVAKS